MSEAFRWWKFVTLHAITMLPTMSSVPKTSRYNISKLHSKVLKFSRKFLTKSLDQAGTSLLAKDLDLRSAMRQRKCFICFPQVSPNCITQLICVAHIYIYICVCVMSIRSFLSLQDAPRSVFGSVHEEIGPCLVNICI